MPGLDYTVGIKVKVDDKDLKKLDKIGDKTVSVKEKSLGINLSGITKLVGLVTVISSGVSAIVGMISNSFFGSGPIKALLQLLQTILNIALLPITLILFYIFKPILILMLKGVIEIYKLLKPVADFFKNWEEANESVDSVLSGISNTLGNLVNAVTGGGLNIMTNPVFGPPGAYASTTPTEENFKIPIKPKVSTPKLDLSDIADKVVGLVLLPFKVISTAILGVTSLVSGFISASIESVLTWFSSQVSFVSKYMVNIWRVFSSKFNAWLSSVWVFIISFGTRIKNAFNKVVDYINGLISKAKSAVESGINWVKKHVPLVNVGDAIITKSGQIIKTHPDDNIIATRGGIGGVVNIYINGVLDEALIDRLAYKLASKGMRVGKW